MSSVVVGELTGRTRDRRIQVRLDQSNRLRPAIELREQHLAEGLGWFDQRCLTLDSNQISQLIGLLGGRDVAGSLDSRPLLEILPFRGSPAIATRQSPAERRADAV
jgi:hypothetical protein